MRRTSKTAPSSPLLNLQQQRCSLRSLLNRNLLLGITKHSIHIYSYSYTSRFRDVHAHPQQRDTAEDCVDQIRGPSYGCEKTRCDARYDNLEQPLRAGCYGTAFCIEVEWEDLVCVSIYGSDGDDCHTSLQTFHDMGPRETPNEKANM